MEDHQFLVLSLSGAPWLGVFRAGQSVRRQSLDNMQYRGLGCCDICNSNARSLCLKLQLIIGSLQARVDAAGKAAEIIV